MDLIEKILIILALIILNGLFAMSEIAIVSTRKSRLEELLRKGNKKARQVMNLSESPNKFLSTVQVGITSIGILLGVFGGNNVAGNFVGIFLKMGISNPYAHNLAIVFVVIIITFFSIVIGELVPKRIGLTNSEAIALIVAKPMIWLSKFSSPFVWMLSISTEFLVRILNIKKKESSHVTEDEIRALIEEGTTDGTIQEIEQDIVERVFHLGDQRIGALMTNRSDIIWLNLSDNTEITKNKIASDNHSVYPVCNNDIDRILGIVYSKDLFIAMLKKLPLDLKNMIKPVNILPIDLKAYQVLDKFKETKIHYGVVVDEYGTIQGMVTNNDILDALVGDITETDEPEVIKRSDNSWLIDGRLAFFEFIHEFEIETYDYSEGHFDSIGGFVIHQLNAIPKTGDHFIWNGYNFEIVDMDGNRIDKILLTKI